MIDTFWCLHCEQETAELVALSFVSNAGEVGSISGFACPECFHMREHPLASPVVTGRIDLGGKPAADWFLDRLRALGCRPERA